MLMGYYLPVRIEDIEVSPTIIGYNGILIE
jgi:hypothetical protein